MIRHDWATELKHEVGKQNVGSPSATGNICLMTWPVTFSQNPHASFLLSTLKSFHGLWRSAAPDFMLIEVDGKHPWQVPICSWQNYFHKSSSSLPYDHFSWSLSKGAQSQEMDFQKWKARHKVISLLNETKGPHLEVWLNRKPPCWVRKLFSCSGSCCQWWTWVWCKQERPLFNGQRMEKESSNSKGTFSLKG